MTERELDKALSQGKSQAGRFFAGMEPVKLRAGAVAARRKARTRGMRLRILAGTAACAAACAGIAVLFTLLADAPATPLPASPGLGEQTVALSDDREYSMNYIPTSQDGSPSGLMMVLWEMREGSRQLAYQSLFESCDIVYPAMTIPFSGSDYDMLLVASGDSVHNELGYRLIGYSQDALQTWWSSDGVPGGVITVANGVVVEKRAAKDGQALPALEVTYIVPIQRPDAGGISLPANSLELQLGDRLLLAAFETGGLEIRSENGLLKRVEEAGGGVLLEAAGTGSDVLRVGFMQAAQTLDVSITD